MRPVPVVFHIGPLAIHTYGIGLAITFWFAYRYFARRLRAHGYPDAWLASTFVLVVVAAVVGARAVHVIANLSYYEAQPAKVLAIWQGGLSSFGGLLLGVPTGFWSARRRCPQLRAIVAADIVSPVLAIAWGVGRLLGPQLMIAGGGKPTTAWFGMYYAGEVGKRLPVPIFQALECGVVFLVALRVEAAVRRRGGPLGFVAAVTAGLWGLSRFFDESVLLPHGNGGRAVEVAALAFFALGLGLAAVLWRRALPRAGEVDLWAAPAPAGGAEDWAEDWAEDGAGPGAATGTKDEVAAPEVSSSTGDAPREVAAPPLVVVAASGRAGAGASSGDPPEALAR